MGHYAAMPSGLILPEELARTEISAALSASLPLSYGTYRSASSRNRNTLAWFTSSGSADVDTLGDLQTLRQQSSDLMRNEPLAAGAIGTMVIGVVGTGVVPQSRIDAEFLGMTTEAAATFERAAERIFYHVANRQDFDSARRANFWQAQRLIYRSAKERGDVFALHRMLPRAGKALATAAQIVEGDRVDTPSAESMNSNIRAGIEFDSDGAVTAYHFSQHHPGETCNIQEFTRVPAFDQRGEPMVLHVFTQLRPGQTRGVPHLAPVIELFKQLGRYTEAEVSAAVTSAMLAIFVTTPTPGTGPLGAGIPGMVGGQQIVPKGNGLQKMQSGMIVDLAPGEDIKVAEATRPNTAFEAFCDAVLGAAGAALGLPRDVLTKRYNSSYSAARASLQDAWRMYLVERDDLNSQFNQPIWNWVIDEAVARGLLDAPGYFDDPLVREAYLGTQWIGPGLQSLDPLKDARASTEWHALGVKSKQDICAENGTDFDRTLQQRAKEKKAEDDAGLTPPEPTQPATASPPPNSAAQAMADLASELTLLESV